MNIGYGKVHACPKHVSSIHLRMMLNLARPRGKDMVKRVDLAINCCVCCQKMDRKAVHVGSSMPSSLTSHKELNSSNKLANHDTPAGFCYHLRQMMIHNDPYMPQLCMLKKGGNFWFSPLLYLEKRCVCFTFFFPTLMCQSNRSLLFVSLFFQDSSETQLQVTDLRKAEWQIFWLFQWETYWWILFVKNI